VGEDRGAGGGSVRGSDGKVMLIIVGIVTNLLKTAMLVTKHLALVDVIWFHE